MGSEARTGQACLGVKGNRMPFKSKAQQRYLYAKEPKVAERFAKETPRNAYKNLPDRVKRKKRRKFSDIAKNLD